MSVSSLSCLSPSVSLPRVILSANCSLRGASHHLYPDILSVLGEHIEIDCFLALESVSKVRRGSGSITYLSWLDEQLLAPMLSKSNHFELSLPYGG